MNKNRKNIKILRFKNGDTIICSLAVDDSKSSFNFYLLERPMQISMIPIVSKKGVQSMSIFMQEWLEYSKDTVFKIPEDVIMVIASPEEEMINEYIDAIEKNDMHRIQRQFEDISKNYDKDSEEESDNYLNNEYNTDSGEYEEDNDEYYEDEEGRPDDSD